MTELIDFTREQKINNIMKAVKKLNGYKLTDQQIKWNLTSRHFIPRIKSGNVHSKVHIVCAASQ